MVIALSKPAEYLTVTATADVRMDSGEKTVRMNVIARPVTASLVHVLLKVSLSMMKGVNVIPFKRILMPYLITAHRFNLSNKNYILITMSISLMFHSNNDNNNNSNSNNSHSR